MPSGEMIPAKEFCSHHNIDLSFIVSLQDYGLLEISEQEHEIYIPVEQLKPLEVWVRLHQEMDINLEGIDTISYLLKQIETLQHKLAVLHNRLRLYEETEI
jgi:hypothetical protein